MAWRGPVQPGGGSGGSGEGPGLWQDPRDEAVRSKPLQQRRGRPEDHNENGRDEDIWGGGRQLQDGEEVLGGRNNRRQVQQRTSGGGGGGPGWGQRQQEVRGNSLNPQPRMSPLAQQQAQLIQQLEQRQQQQQQLLNQQQQRQQKELLQRQEDAMQQHMHNGPTFLFQGYDTGDLALYQQPPGQVCLWLLRECTGSGKDSTNYWYICWFWDVCSPLAV